MDRAEAIKWLRDTELLSILPGRRVALKMAIAALREQDATDINVGNKWISVEDRLPEDWAIVQIVEDNGYVWLPKIGEYRHGRNQWFVEGCFEASHGWLEDEKMFHVTHWMPLPAPPKGGATT